VTLTQCPYDATPIEIEHVSGGSMLLVCPTCGAQWERHGAWIRRVHEPDWQKVIAKRRLPSGDEHRNRTGSR
jgi:hypothetical protein